MQRQYIIPRCSHKEATFAVVDCEHEHSVTSIEEFKVLLIQAITSWVSNTVQGKAYWHNTNYDFNVGDLDEVQDDPALVEELKAVGITNLEVQCFSTDAEQLAWQFDDILVDAGKRWADFEAKTLQTNTNRTQGPES